MTPRYKRPTGTLDILPEDRPYWRFLEQTIHELMRLYGYQQIDVPVFEYTELYVRGVGEGTDIVEKEMYTFLDKSNDSLTLRPEFTAGIARAYVEHHMYKGPQPVKLYAIGPVFRYERPQAGRYRQHTQVSVEAFGEQDPALDFEILSLAHHLFTRLGFRDLYFQLNSTGCPVCRPRYVEALKAYYMAHYDEIDQDCKRRLQRNPLRVLDCKAEQCQPVIAGAPNILDYLCDDCRTHFERLRMYLDDAGLKYVLNPRLVRGLDYYTKTVFEVWAEGIGAQAAICGGGRYDGLVAEIGGPEVPGIGFGAGWERIILAMKAQGITPPPLPGLDVLVAHFGAATKPVAVRVATQLREAGIATWLAFGERSLKSQMREANRLGVRYTVIVGEDELSRQAATVRDMVTGVQQEVPLADLVAWLHDQIAQLGQGVSQESLRVSS